MALEEWRGAADSFRRYFALEEQIRADGAADGPRWVEPQLGAAYGRFHFGYALYQLGEVEGSAAQLEAYLAAVARYEEIVICTIDAWGNEIHTELDKEMARQRKWMVSGRCEYPARRMSASMLAQRAVAHERAGGALAEVRADLSRAVEHLNAATELAVGEAQHDETATELERVLRGLAQLDGGAGRTGGE